MILKSWIKFKTKKKTNYNIYCYCVKNFINEVDENGLFGEELAYAGVALGSSTASTISLLGVVTIVGWILAITAVVVLIGVLVYKTEHTKNARKSTREKHQKGQATKKRQNYGGEKGDARRKPLHPPPKNNTRRKSGKGRRR